MENASSPNNLIAQLPESERVALIADFLREQPDLLQYPELRASVVSFTQRFHNMGEAKFKMLHLPPPANPSIKPVPDIF